MKISIIMPVRLSFYEGQTKNPKEKFIRAIDSYLSQSYKNSELIIASDGCEDATKIVKSPRYAKYLKTGFIKLLELPKHELFTGALRQSAINIATGDLLGNLDADDVILPNHLWNISVAADLNKFDWFYYNLYRKLDNLKGVEELVNATPDLDGLCNGNLLWKRSLDVTWNNCDGRSDSKGFISQILEKYPRRGCKLYGCSYIVKNASISHVSG
jgi:glycosyltransferase involved in cell wall biosynthesis